MPDHGGVSVSSQSLYHAARLFHFEPVVLIEVNETILELWGVREYLTKREKRSQYTQ